MTTFHYRHMDHMDVDSHEWPIAAVDEILAHDWWQRSAYSYPYRSDYIDDFLATNHPQWWGEASRDEVQAFSLCICTCGHCEWDNRPDGSSIAGMSTEEIRSLLLLASQPLTAPRQRTRW